MKGRGNRRGQEKTDPAPASKEALSPRVPQPALDREISSGNPAGFGFLSFSPGVKGEASSYSNSRIHLSPSLPLGKHLKPEMSRSIPLLSLVEGKGLRPPTIRSSRSGSRLLHALDMIRASKGPRYAHRDGARDPSRRYRATRAMRAKGGGGGRRPFPHSLYGRLRPPNIGMLARPLPGDTQLHRYTSPVLLAIFYLCSESSFVICARITISAAAPRSADTGSSSPIRLCLQRISAPCGFLCVPPPPGASVRRRCLCIPPWQCPRDRYTLSLRNGNLSGIVNGRDLTSFSLMVEALDQRRWNGSVLSNSKGGSAPRCSAFFADGLRWLTLGSSSVAGEASLLKLVRLRVRFVSVHACSRDRRSFVYNRRWQPGVESLISSHPQCALKRPCRSTGRSTETTLLFPSSAVR
eukprot:Gb_40320 [translate_table: standard]